MFLNLHKTFKAGFTVLQFPKNVLILANSADPDKRTSLSSGSSLFSNIQRVKAIRWHIILSYFSVEALCFGY